MKMKGIRTLTAALAGALAVLGAAPESAGAGTLDEVKKRGELLAGVRYDMPPFGYADKQGKVEGIDVEIVKYVAAKLGVKVKYQQVTAQTRVPMLLNGNVDLVAAGMAETEERKKVIDFSATYLESGNLFLVKKDSPLKSFKDMEGKTIATIQGTPYVQKLQQKVKSFTPVSFQEYPQAVLAVEQGKADALLADDTTLVQLSTDRKDTLKLIGNVRDFDLWLVGLGVRKNDDEWRSFLNKTLAEMWEKGELKKAVAAYGLTYDPDFKIKP